MTDPRQIAAALSDDECQALHSLAGEGAATILSATAGRLHARGLATFDTDGALGLTELGRDVLRLLRDEQD